MATATTVIHACTRKPADVKATVERDSSRWWLDLESNNGIVASTPIVCCPWCGLMLMAPKQPMAVADAHVAGD